MSALVSLRSAVFGQPEQPEDGDDQSLVTQAISTALTPVRIATSRSAIKVYLSTILFFATSAILLSVSTSAYALFYYRYIPQINLERTVYFQYGAGVHPHATIPLQTTGLISQQAYDIDIVLHMPRTASNRAAGNFMLDLSLLTTSTLVTPAPPFTNVLPNTSLPTGYTTIDRSRRPAILPYSSLITSLSHTLLHLPGHLLSLRDVDSSVLKVPMYERIEFPRGRSNIPTHVYIELQSQSCLSSDNCPPQPVATAPTINLLPHQSTSQTMSSIQIYTAKIMFRARFTGLRYIIYNYRIVSFLIFTALFYMFAMISMATAWAVISTLTSLNKQSTKSSSSSNKMIKSEDSTAAISDTSISKSQGKGTLKEESTTTAEKRALYNIKAEEEEEDGVTPDTSDAEHDARTGAMITDHHDAEDEDEDEDEEEEVGPELSPPSRSRSGSGLGIKQEEGDDDDDGRRFVDSGIGTSMESEVVASGSGSGVVRRRSGRENGSRSGSRIGRREDD